MIKIINAKIVDPDSRLQPVELLIDQDKLIEIGPKVGGGQAQVLDAEGKLVSPGFIDLHVHFREPGFEYKESIYTGSRAAAKGGYTTVVAMPNTKPVLDHPAVLRDLKARIDRDSLIETLYYSAITLGQEGQDLVDFDGQLAAGAVAFSDDGKGVQSPAMMYDAMVAVKARKSILAAHCEDDSLLRGGYIHAGPYAQNHKHKGILSLCEDLQIARDCAIALATGASYHICHMSTASGVDLLRYYQGKCDHISGEVTPHHLLLCQDDLKEDGDFKMNPPLRRAQDRDALVKALAEGVISCIATDHAPHSAEEKAQGLAGSPFGIVGLETAFALLYTNLVLTNKVPLYTLIQAMTTNPAKLFGLAGHDLKAGQRADLVLIDLEAEYEIKKENLVGKSKNTPFAGYRVKGMIDTVFYQGKVIVKGGQIIE